VTGAWTHQHERKRMQGQQKSRFLLAVAEKMPWMAFFSID
jgi:hypothetical protein